MDIMFYKEDGIVWIRAYMDVQKVMYESSLRHYESDINREQQVILSGYRFYNYNELTKKYDLLVYDFSADQKQWVRLLEKTLPVWNLYITMIIKSFESFRVWFPHSRVAENL